MDSTSIVTPTTEQRRSSRLPAGSTLEISPGVFVPHPHAEVNLAGAGDPRLGSTDAVTETLEQMSVAVAQPAAPVVALTAVVADEPLSEQDKVK